MEGPFINAMGSLRNLTRTNGGGQNFSMLIDYNRARGRNG